MRVAATELKPQPMGMVHISELRPYHPEEDDARRSGKLIDFPAAKTESVQAGHDQERKFASTQVDLPAEFHKFFKNGAERIKEADLAEDGRETEPHITVKFGLHGEDPAPVKKLLAEEGPITAKIGKVSIFPASETSAQRGGSQFDVVKLDVESPDLHRLNAKVAALPHTDTHPEYHPHMTLAYVKAGTGEKYAGRSIPGLTGKRITFDTVTFSDHDSAKTAIPLKKNRS